jgi:hypothetical protein
LRSTCETAQRLLESLLGGQPWPRAWLAELIENESPALFSVLAEGLSDRFEPRLVEVYTEVFSEVIAAVLPERQPAALVERYHRVRRPRRIGGEPRTVFVLSRVTLGADVAITSVVLDAVKRRCPRARIVLVGPRKSWELFSADPRIEHLPVNYGRSGALRDRILSSLRLDEPDSIVVDPDSRIGQLGLLPICPEENYYFFESRTYGGDGPEPLGALVRRWAADTFEIGDARSWIAPAEAPEFPAGGIAVSFGVGGNRAKRVADPFEARLLAALAARGLPVVLDAGAGGEEAERVERAVASSGARVEIWRGSFAGFASVIARSRLYAGYDSAGQHVAATCGVPLVTVFAGAPCRRFEERWRPFGPGPAQVIRADACTPETVLAETLQAVGREL